MKMNISKNSFFFHLISRSMILMCFVLLVLFIYQVNKIDDNNLKNQHENLNQHVEYISSEISAKMTSLRQDLAFIAKSPTIQTFVKSQSSYVGQKNLLNEELKDKISKIFTGFLEAKSHYINVKLVDLNDDGQELINVVKVGNHVIRVGDNDLRKLGKSEQFKVTSKLKEQEIYLSDLSMKIDNKFGKEDLILYSSIPMYFEGKMYGYVQIDLLGHSLLKRRNALQNDRNLRIHMIDSTLKPIIYNGSFIFDTQMDLGKYHDLFSFLKSPKLTQENIVSIENEIVYSAKKTYYNPLNDQQFITILASKDRSALNQDFYSDMLQDFGVIAMVILVALIFNILYIRFMGEPIIKLKEFALKMASGEKFDIDEYAKNNADEFVDLARTIDKLTTENRQNTQVLEYQKNALDVIALVSETDQHGRIVYANNKFANVSQFTLFELLDQDHKIVSSHFHEKAFFKSMWDTILSGETWHGVIKNKKKNGDYFWVDCYIVPFKNEKGIIKKYISIATDITKQKEEEEKLNILAKEMKTLNLRFKLALEASQIGIWDWDLIADKVHWDENMFSLYGSDFSDFNGDMKYWSQFIHQEDRQSIIELLNRALRGEEIFDTSIRFCFSNQETKIFRSLADVTFEDGKAVRMIGVNWDCTKEVERTKDLEILKIKAEEASLAKSEFLSNMSHEIRTPMNAVIGMTELLQETKIDKMQSKYIESLKNASESLLILINDILDMAKIEAGQIDIDNNPYNFEDTLNRVCEMLHNIAVEKDIQMAVKYSFDGNYHIYGDEHRFRQVMTNLIGNAIKFTPAEGVVMIEVGVNQEDHTIFASVLDKGIGIASEKIESIFEPFTQADSSIAPEFGGTGLGLPISQKLAVLMGGEITVKSELGVGSCFTLSLPYKEVKNIEVKKYSDFKNFVGKNFLVVDDRDFNRQILKETLENWGAVVTLDENAQDCLDSIYKSNERGKTIDAIICDNNMPNKSGIDLGEQLNKNEKFKDIPFIITTSNLNSGDLKRARNIGVETLLWKPIKRSELWDALSKSISCDKPDISSHVKSSESYFSEESNYKILVAEDQEENRFLIKQFLAQTAIKIEFANNGKVAVDQFKAHTFDMIFMDMKMPVMNGIEATKSIREHEKIHKLKMIPIVALSAYATKKEIDKSIEAGCDRHITKPIRKADLIDVIIKTCEQKKGPSDPMKRDHKGSPSGSIGLNIEDTEGILIEMSDAFKDQMPKFLAKRRNDLDEMYKSLKDLDFAHIEDIGHNLAGICPAYGFNKLGEIGAELEKLAADASSDALEDKLEEYKIYLNAIKITFTSD